MNLSDGVHITSGIHNAQPAAYARRKNNPIRRPDSGADEFLLTPESPVGLDVMVPVCIPPDHQFVWSSRQRLERTTAAITGRLGIVPFAASSHQMKMTTCEMTAPTTAQTLHQV